MQLQLLLQVEAEAKVGEQEVRACGSSQPHITLHCIQRRVQSAPCQMMNYKRKRDISPGSQPPRMKLPEKQQPVSAVSRKMY